jgi:hypothetical protein
MNNQSTSLSTYRGKGKIARLPKALRDQVNTMLMDGLPYADIIQRLGEHGKHLKPGNLGEWKKRGYQDWLAERAFFDHLRQRQEASANLMHDLDPKALNHATLQLGTLHIFEALRDLSPGASGKNFAAGMDGFARMLNALSRMNRQTMQLHLHPPMIRSIGNTLPGNRHASSTSKTTSNSECQ